MRASAGRDACRTVWLCNVSFLPAAGLALHAAYLAELTNRLAYRFLLKKQVVSRDGERYRSWGVSSVHNYAHLVVLPAPLGPNTAKNLALLHREIDAAHGFDDRSLDFLSLERNFLLRSLTFYHGVLPAASLRSGHHTIKMTAVLRGKKNPMTCPETEAQHSHPLIGKRDATPARSCFTVSVTRNCTPRRTSSCGAIPRLTLSRQPRCCTRLIWRCLAGIHHALPAHARFSWRMPRARCAA